MTIDFEQGIPVAVNGEKMDAVKLLETCNEIAARNGVGIADMVENRLVGMKSRGVYETPGGTHALCRAPAMLEAITVDRDTAHYKEQVAVKFAELVYNGLWYAPLRESAVRVCRCDPEVCDRHGEAQALQGQLHRRGRDLSVQPVHGGHRDIRRCRRDVQPQGCRRASSTSTVCRSRFRP